MFPRILLVYSVLLSALSLCQTSVSTWHYDNARSSADTSETLLTPANVNKNTFGKLFTLPVDGIIVGQPLYVPGVAIPNQGTRNVVYVATMHDSVYAFDASGSSSSPLWSTSLLSFSPPGATTVPASVAGCATTTAWTELGVISTPVIDLSAGTIYLVAETYENSSVVYRLHALDITDGQERPGSPVTITATYSSGGDTYIFRGPHQMNRPGLLLANGHVYAGFGSTGCNGSDQGWIMSYNTSTLQQEGAWEDEPAGKYASIWQKGAGISADSSGYIYAETGEGRVEPGVDLGTSVFKLSQISTTLALADWFTPYNWDYLSANDLDLNDGVLLLPDQPGSHPHELIAEGKEGTVYVLDRDNMGQLCTSCTSGDNQIVQELFHAVGPETGTPVYWNNTVYFTGQHTPVQAYALNQGQLVTPPVAQSIKLAGGGHASITSNGSASGILWFINGNSTLWAMDAVTLKVLYTSTQAANGRDKLPTLAHFATQIVADGRLFVGTRDSLVGYGLLPALASVSGNGQTATVGRPLTTTLQVRAADSYTGSPFAGVTVAFSDGGAGGTFSSASAVTDSTGTVSTNYTLPTKSGSYTITASASGYRSAYFSETATPGLASALVRVSGSGQSAPVKTSLTYPLVARVEDQYGNGVPGVSVSFSDQGAGGIFSGNPITSDLKGKVSDSYTTGTAARNVVIVATAAGLPVLKFWEKVTAGPAATISVVSGNNQTAPSSTTLSEALVVKVVDQYSNAVLNISVTFSDGGAGGAFSVNPAITIANGTASVSYTTGPNAGSVTINAVVSGVASPAVFTISVQ